ncbi:unnamed protein product [Caenorhabditis bovis]|uniref:Ig-like domain-containing protein n=1 Tax=Caenorhabditis bovis TaxID=2654633 RepID=A0A8S1EFY4_9PELO|nr:unnamed protein product [Caenorhabditis bovis]
MRFIIAVALFALGVHASKHVSDVRAIGNLQVVIAGETLFTTDIDENRPPTPDLWCQIEKHKRVLPADWARFVRAKDHKVFLADYLSHEHKAFLHFGKSSAEHAGVYRCEIKEPNGNIIIGNMFAYSHPVVKNDENWPLKKSDQEEGLVLAPSVYASYQTTAFIKCPIIAYPEPKIFWYKNNVPLDFNDRIKYNATAQALQISDVQEEDAGVYRCNATNQFPVVIDGPKQEFSVKLEQELRVGDNYGWMLPLAVIIIILLILFLVIFTCQRCAKYKADHYNVAERERALHNDQVPLKNSV